MPEFAGPMRGGSLARRLGLAFAVIIALGGGGVAIAAFSFGRNAAQQSYDRLLVGAANQIAGSVTLQGGEVVIDLPVSAFELLALAPDDRVVYAVYDAMGRLITGYEELVPPEGDVRFFRTEFAREPIRAVRVSRPFAERTYSGRIDVLVGQTLQARKDLAAQITRNALVTAALITLVMAGLAALAVFSALAPIRRIERALRLRSPQDMTPIDVATPREVSSLVEALNRFMARLDRQFEIMRNLIADASHQLRTPIAAMRAQAELAAEEEDPARLRQILERVHARSVNLGRLTDQLLKHALIIHRADAVALERLDLRKVAIAAMEEVEHAHFGRERPVELELAEDPVWCDGDRLSLVEAVKNLAANALNHGQEPVFLSVSVREGVASIAVRDAGPGLPQEYWTDAGTRFARRSGASADSAGLGLAIVASVAAAQGGRLEFRNLSPSGFEASIRLPLREKGPQ
ncbi:sensor histidine kinase N-terminal domain-containing protein [Amaricoccus macauensis]|uniref:sensor histidine kinase N-terminal domain-containing protein n=1 Tax=Amaricoccus macauensis TaxID=57001 RepID=UPI003C7C0CD6